MAQTEFAGEHAPRRRIGRRIGLVVLGFVLALCFAYPISMPVGVIVYFAFGVNNWPAIACAMAITYGLAIAAAVAVIRRIW